MDDHEHARWAAYARELADDLGLRDWLVFINRVDPFESEALASANVTEGSRILSICLSRNFRHSETPEDQRVTMIHELLHAHGHRLQRLLDHTGTQIEGPAWNLYLYLHREEIEHLVDAIAVAIAPHYPLPPAARED